MHENSWKRKQIIAMSSLNVKVYKIILTFDLLKKTTLTFFLKSKYLCNPCDLAVIDF